jgi:hypothetical protein
MALTSVSSAGSHAAVSIGTSAAVIRVAKSGRKSIVIQNAHASQDLYVGTTSSVTTANGVKIPAGQSFSFDDYNGALYGIASGAATDVRYFEVG